MQCLATGDSAVADGAPAKSAVDEHQLLLEVLHSLENPNNVTRVGRRGELGPYQFRPATWRMHTSKPFSQANDHATASEIATLHCDWLRRGLQKRGLEPTVYNLALAWNAGLDATIKGRATGQSHRYAQRAHNLWTDLRSTREKEAAAAMEATKAIGPAAATTVADATSS